MLPRVAETIRDWFQFIAGKSVCVVSIPAQLERVDDSLCSIHRCSRLSLFDGFNNKLVQGVVRGQCEYAREYNGSSQNEETHN
jgi:hypothetical protein